MPPFRVKIRADKLLKDFLIRGVLPSPDAGSDMPIS